MFSFSDLLLLISSCNILCILYLHFIFEYGGVQGSRIQYDCLAELRQGCRKPYRRGGCGKE